MESKTANPILKGFLSDKPFLKKASEFLVRNQGTVTLLLFALMFVFTLCVATPFAPLMGADDNSNHTYAQPMINMSTPIDYVMIIAIFGCLIAVCYKLFRNNSRRIYYTSNYAYLGVLIVYTLVCGVALLMLSNYFNVQYSSIDFAVVNNATPEEGMDKYSLVFHGYNAIPTTSPVGNIGIALAVIILIQFGLEVYSLIYKIITSKETYNSIYNAPNNSILEREAK